MKSKPEEYKQACDEVLLSRAKSAQNSSQSICISGEDIDGVHMKYTSEYLSWNLKVMWAKVTVHLTDEERKQWFIDNPEPEVKFVNHKEQITDIVGEEKL